MGVERLPVSFTQIRLQTYVSGILRQISNQLSQLDAASLVVRLPRVPPPGQAHERPRIRSQCAAPPCNPVGVAGEIARGMRNAGETGLEGEWQAHQRGVAVGAARGLEIS